MSEHAADPPRASRRAQLWAVGLGLLLVGATALLFLGETHQRAGVWLAAPLDDTFIHFQYAKQLARGRVLQFNDGDAPSTGATSLLYLLVLAPGWLLGLRGLLLLVWAWFLNGALHLLGGLGVFGLVRRLTGSRSLGYTAEAAYLISGPLLWGAFSHMEVALFSSLLVGSLWAAVRLEEGEPGARRWLLVLGSLLALTRPEGALLAGGLTLWLLWRHLPTDAEARPLRQRLRGAAPLLWPLASGLGMLLVFLLLTGRISTNASIKSHLSSFGDDPGRYVETTLGWLPMTLQILLEKWPGFLLPLTSALGLGGLCVWALSGTRRRPGTGLLVLLWIALLTLFYALAIARRDHFDRYYLPYVGLVLTCVWWALGRLGRLGAVAARAVLLGSGLLLLFMIPDTLSWARRFGDNCRDLAVQHFRVAEWLREHTPPETRIAVNDAGAIPYLSERYAYDIVGLVHNAFYRKKNHMPRHSGPVWEAMERLPRRPELLVAYPEWIPDLVSLPILAVEKRFTLLGRTMVANDTKVVWRLRWDLLLDADAPPPGLPGQRAQDALDVADLDDETAHRYTRLGPGAPEGVVAHERRGDKFLIDAGRLVREGEAFTLRARPGAPALLVLRTSGPGRLDVELSVEDQSLGRWQALRPAGLGVLSFQIPATRVTSEKLRFRLSRPKEPYSSYHYWLLQ